MDRTLYEARRCLGRAGHTMHRVEEGFEPETVRIVRSPQRLRGAAHSRNGFKHGMKLEIPL